MARIKAGLTRDELIKAKGFKHWKVNGADIKKADLIMTPDGEVWYRHNGRHMDAFGSLPDSMQNMLLKNVSQEIIPPEVKAV